jgi:hypothetical protein
LKIEISPCGRNDNKGNYDIASVGPFQYLQISHPVQAGREMMQLPVAAQP